MYIVVMGYGKIGYHLVRTLLAIGHEVLVITPQSPLGSQLQGRQPAEQLELSMAGAKQQIKVISVY